MSTQQYFDPNYFDPNYFGAKDSEPPKQNDPNLPYSIPRDVRHLITTELDDDEVARIIWEVDRDLDDRISRGSMNLRNKKYCSMRLAAIVIAQQQRGSYSQIYTDNRSIAEWRREVNSKILNSQGGRWSSIG
jgi:hypothetical protein